MRLYDMYSVIINEEDFDNIHSKKSLLLDYGRSMYPIISENNTGIQNIQKGDHLIGINNDYLIIKRKTLRSIISDVDSLVEKNDDNLIVLRIIPKITPIYRNVHIKPNGLYLRNFKKPKPRKTYNFDQNGSYKPHFKLNDIVRIKFSNGNFLNGKALDQYNKGKISSTGRVVRWATHSGWYTLRCNDGIEIPIRSCNLEKCI